jgi:Histidine phosphatase superfamily (branch 1)
MERRAFPLATLTALASPWLAQAQTESFAANLRAGACALVLRHAQTTPGIGDPPGFRLDRCSSQRNLSEPGRQQARDIGRWFQAQGLQPHAVRCSAWCRCIDTAELAFGQHQVWSALNSFFDAADAQLRQAEQSARLRASLGKVPTGQFEVWVTHQVNITALTGESPSMGEALLVCADGKLKGRSTFT